MEILTSVKRLYISFKSLVNDLVYSFGRAALWLLVEVSNHTVPVRARGRIRVNLGARWGGWSTPRPGRFTHGKCPLPIVKEAGWAPGPDWTVAENLAPTGIRSLDRPARSESPYSMSYRGVVVNITVPDDSGSHDFDV
jgi:hypothetical protein